MAGKKQNVRWNLAGYFTEFDGTEMAAFKKKLLSDAAGLRNKAAKLSAVSPKNFTEWEELVLSAEDCSSRFRHFSSYLGGLEAVDPGNKKYGKKTRLISGFAALEELESELLRALTGVSNKVFSEFVKRKKLKPIAYYLHRIRNRIKYGMLTEKEKYAADMKLYSSYSSAGLYDQLVDKLEFEMVWPDKSKEKLPIALGISLMSDADRPVGKAAFEGANRAWATIEDSCAYALNSIAGTRLTLDKQRGVPWFMDGALVCAGVRGKTLVAMYKDIDKNLGTAREILKTKARSMGRKGIRIFEREAAPSKIGYPMLTWADGFSKYSDTFDSGYPALGEYYHKFAEKCWMDVRSHGRKRPGELATDSAVSAEERVCLSFCDSFRDVSIVDHDMGRAWQSYLMRNMRPWACKHPMTLSEAAAIFAERILPDGVLTDKKKSGGRKAAIPGADLCSAAAFILDITARFEFEKAFYEERLHSEVPVARLKALMCKAQRSVYGDALEPGGEDPLLWASRRHFYRVDVPFYNFPYSLGFLFASALFARLKGEKPVFRSKYKAFLRMAGRNSAVSLPGSSMGINLGEPSFWAAQFSGVKASMAEYKKLLAAKSAA